MNGYENNGFEIHPSVLDDRELRHLRDEAERLQNDSGTSCVRRIREKSRHIQALSQDGRLLRLIPPGFRPVRSILFDKTPNENWPVAWHQDLTICVDGQQDLEGFGPWSTKDGVPHVQPPVALLETMTTLRIHLDATPAGNGALRVIPGSHRLGRLGSERIRSEVARGEVICECSPGDILRMSPLILHASSRSETPMRRRIIHLEFAPHHCLPSGLSFHEQ